MEESSATRNCGLQHDCRERAAGGRIGTGAHRRRHDEARQQQPGKDEKQDQNQEGAGKGRVGGEGAGMDGHLRADDAGHYATGHDPGNGARLEGGFGRVGGGEAILLGEGIGSAYQHHRNGEEPERGQDDGAGGKPGARWRQHAMPVMKPRRRPTRRIQRAAGIAAMAEPMTKVVTGRVASPIWSGGRRAAPTSPPVPMEMGPTEPPMAVAAESSRAARLASASGR